MTRLLWVEIPMRLPSTANLREHWSAKAKRAKAQRQAVALALKSHNLRQGVLDGIAEQTRGGQLLVRFTRISPRKLDSDNLAIAFKHCRDQVAEHFGTDDGSDQWDWAYAQEPGHPAIRIEVWCAVSVAIAEAMERSKPLVRDALRLGRSLTVGGSGGVNFEALLIR